MERRLVLGLHRGERVDVQRLLRERRAERDASSGIVTGERHAAPQARDGAHRVPGPRDVEHRGDVADAVAEPDDRRRQRAGERELGRRHHACPELVLQAVHLDAVQTAVGIAHLDEEEREPAAARPGALGASERERHVGRDGRREPLGAVEPPAFRRLARDRLREAHVGAARPLRHPLPGGPCLGWIARRQPRHDAVTQCRLGGDLERARAAVGHGERTRVDLRRRREEIHERELLQARVLTVRPLVGRRDQALFHRGAAEVLPRIGHDDLVDAVPPGIPLHELGLLAVRRHRRVVQITDGARPHAGQRRRDRVEHRRRHTPTEKALQHTMSAEHRRGLEKRHGDTSSRPATYAAREKLSTARPAPPRCYRFTRRSSS